MRNNRETGRHYEAEAERFLKAKGYRTLESGYTTRWGEIDLIMRKGNHLSFVEVKYRRNHDYGYPEEAVDAEKQRRIVKSAAFYMMKSGLTEVDVSFDVVAIEGEEIRYIPNAFSGF